jgi:hypothetical protein
MKPPQRDARLASFMRRHSQICGAVTVERLESIMPGLTLRVRCRCGVSAEWWLPERATDAFARRRSSDRLSA